MTRTNSFSVTAPNVPRRAAGSSMVTRTDRTAEVSTKNSTHNPEKTKAMALIALAANFGKELPEALFTLWLDLLAPYPAALVEQAVKKVILKYEYKTLPPFAVLQKEIDALRGTSGKSLEMQAAAEWVWLMDAIREYGRYLPPQTMHPTTAYVLKLMGGWKTACSWAENGMEFKRRDFITHWTDCHGNVKAMDSGADGVLVALAILREHPQCSGQPVFALAPESMGSDSHGKEAAYE